MTRVVFDSDARYILAAYDSAPPFSSFLPGIAGPRGVPMWAFYVNRGQAIASFGIESKDHPLLEFQSANRAYQQTPFLGFRTFLKLGKHPFADSYEPFAPWAPGQPRRHMHIDLNKLSLVEHNPHLGLETQVVYFILPGAPLAALVRQLTLRNTGEQPLELELVDGLPALIPYGVDNDALKNISRTVEAWMQVEDHASGLPFYRLRASAADIADVSTIQGGHFAFAWIEEAGDVRHLPALVDPELIFARDTSLQSPAGFLARPLTELLDDPQRTSGVTPSAFFGGSFTLAPGGQTTLTALFGHTSSRARLATLVQRLSDPALIAAKRTEARALGDQITRPVSTRSAQPLFDGYCRQTFLDNVLRGGWPELLGDPSRPHVYYIYSHKHGDLERDYNDFFLPAEYYSQGNGNFRDVAQNRRNDVWFQPPAGEFNIRLHLSLIQIDGYNPLVLEGMRFVAPPQAQASLLAHSSQPEQLAPLLAEPFTPGDLLKAIEDREIPLDVSPSDFLTQALHQAEQKIEASFGEGYWIDHWTYLLDFIESFQAIFPEQLPALLLETELPYFKSPAVVQPRSEKYVLTETGPRQFHAVCHDPDGEETWLRAGHGRGPIFRSRVLEKLFLLALLKFATRDPWGMGVEMEAGKPGWYDALNGLPGLFGSSMPESHELLRLLHFLQDAVDAYQPSLQLPTEAYTLLQAVVKALDDHPQASFQRWDACATARERYRHETQSGVSGETVALSAQELGRILAQMVEDVAQGIARAETQGSDLPPTYFAWTMTEYDVQRDASGEERRDDQGRPLLRARAFQPRPLPPFLEGPARALKILPADEARRLHAQMKASSLWDEALGMFKINSSLEGEPHDIGRARAFTPGWLENESIWLHMHYKYLLALLLRGFYEEFFALVPTGLIPFRDPQQYGRSPLENSSFLVSSAHPDAKLHGRGFVARLSGATAEFLHMWTLMMAGPQPFVEENGHLILRLRPALPGDFFDMDNLVQFTFLGQCKVSYHNPERRDLFTGTPRQIHLEMVDGASVNLPGPDIPAPFAAQVRDGQVRQIDIEF